MYLAVGECECANTVGMPGGEDLRDGSPRVVSDKVGCTELERSAAGLHEVGQPGQREVLILRGRCTAVQWQIHRYGPPARALNLRDDVTPQVAARAQSMQEHRSPARATGVDATRHADGCRDQGAVLVERLQQGHDPPPARWPEAGWPADPPGSDTPVIPGSAPLGGPGIAGMAGAGRWPGARTRN